MLDYIFILPVLNEEAILAHTTDLLYAFLHAKWNKKNAHWKIVIVDNGSTDNTAQIAQQLRQRDPEHIDYLFTPVPGRGQALQKAVQAYTANIYLYVDVDLPMQLTGIEAMLRPLEQHAADVVVGKRHGSRPLIRRVLTRFLYWCNIILFDLPVHDAQCGIKAFRSSAIPALLACQEQGYFLDTELLVRAASSGRVVQEINVEWIERRFQQRTSKVRLIRDSQRAVQALYRLLHIQNPRMLRDSLVLLGIGVCLCLGYVLIKYTVELPDFAIPSHVVSLKFDLGNVILAMGIVYTCFLFAIRSIARLPWRLNLIICLVIGAILWSLAIWLHPTYSQDIYWNLFLARGFTSYGFNPYLTIPNQLPIDAWSHSVVAWRDLSMTHGPLSTLWMMGITTLTSSLQLALVLSKATMAACLGLTLWLVWKIMDHHKIEPRYAVLWLILLAWNPFILNNTLVEVHNDIIMVLGIVASYYCTLRSQFFRSIILLVLAGYVKYLAWFLLPIPIIYWVLQKKNKTSLLIAIAATVGFFLIAGSILYAPFGLTIDSFFGLNGEIVHRFSQQNILLGSWLFSFFVSYITSLEVIYVRAFGAILAVIAFIYTLRRRKLVSAYILPFSLLLFFGTPWFQTWYALWVIFFWPYKIRPESFILLSVALLCIPNILPALIMSMLAVGYYLLGYVAVHICGVKAEHFFLSMPIKKI